MHKDRTEGVGENASLPVLLRNLIAYVKYEKNTRNTKDVLMVRVLSPKRWQIKGDKDFLWRQYTDHQHGIVRKWLPLD
jgi:hypothetical protein